VVFCIVTPCNDVVGYQHFGVPWRQQGPLKHWFPTTELRGVTTQKTATQIFIAVRKLFPWIQRSQKWQDVINFHSNTGICFFVYPLSTKYPLIHNEGTSYTLHSIHIKMWPWKHFIHKSSHMNFFVHECEHGKFLLENQWLNTHNNGTFKITNTNNSHAATYIWMHFYGNNMSYAKQGETDY